MAGAIAIMFFVGGLMVTSVPYRNAKKMKKDNVNKVKLYDDRICTACFCGIEGKGFSGTSDVYFTGLARVDMAAWILEERHAENRD